MFVAVAKNLSYAQSPIIIPTAAAINTDSIDIYDAMENRSKRQRGLSNLFTDEYDRDQNDTMQAGNAPSIFGGYQSHRKRRKKPKSSKSRSKSSKSSSSSSKSDVSVTFIFHTLYAYAFI